MTWGRAASTSCGLRLFLDANASEPLRPAAREAVLRALELGNPSSVHAEGRAARAALEQARATLAARFGGEVVFTSGGTEANALAVRALGAGRRILVGSTEHAAVLAAAADAERVPVLRDGTLDLAALDQMLDGPPALVCAMAANNETGVFHALRETAALCRARGALLHTDAVQAAREGFSLAESGADTAALSAHKLGGPKGAGALLVRPGLALAPLIGGGGQERGRRGGTEALPALLGFAAAVPERGETACLAAMRDGIEAGIRALAPEAVIAGGAAPRLANTTLVVLPGIPAETQVIALDLAGVAVSAGAACSSGRVARSHVLEAMGLDAACGLRVSLPWNAAVDAPERFVEAWGAMRARLSRRRAGSATCAT